MPRKIFVARNMKANLHSVFEVLPASYVQERRGVLGIDDFNSLSGWKSLEELFSALEKFGPFIASSLHEGVPRAMPIGDAIDMLATGGDFGKVNEGVLQIQLYLDGKAGGYPSKASTARAVTKYGLFENNGIEELIEWRSSDPSLMVVIEPVSDLTFVRNMASLLLRIVANYQNEQIGDVLTASGFKRYGANLWGVLYKEARTPHLMIPFRHNPGMDGLLTMSPKWWRSAGAYDVGNSLGSRIAMLRPEGSDMGFGSIDGAVEASAQVANGKLVKFTNIGFDYSSEDTRKYLGVLDDGNERESARHFIEGAASMFSRLDGAGGAPIGWEVGDMSDLLDNDSPKPLFRTLAAAIIGTVLLRYDMIPAVCKNCGNGMMIKPKGKRREFCSDTCRSQYSSKPR